MRLGRVLTEQDAKGQITTHVYTENAQQESEEVTQTLENGKIAKSISIYGTAAKKAFPTTVKQYYTDKNNQYKEVSTTNSYNLLLGVIESEVDSAGKTTSYQYDNVGRLLKITEPTFTNTDGESFSVEHVSEYLDAATSPLFDAENSGLSTFYVKTYDNVKRLSDNVARIFNRQDTYYNSYGDEVLDSSWDDQRNTWIVDGQYHYDNQKRLTSYVDAEQNSTSYSYDPWGSVNESIDPHGNLYRIDYDLVNRKTTSYMIGQADISAFRADPTNDTLKWNVLETLVDQWGYTVQRNAYPNWPNNTSNAVNEYFSYDIQGNQTSYIDPNGNAELYTYDPLNQLVKVKDALGQVTEYGYTVLGDLATFKMTDGTKTWTTSKEYDELGELKKKIDPAQKTETFVTNDLGQVVQWKNPKQVDFSYTYDEMSRQTNETSGSTTFRTKYDYTPFGPGTLEELQNGSVSKSISYGYDPSGNVNSKAFTFEGFTQTVTNEYNRNDDVTSVKDSFNFYTHYFYDKDRVNKVQVDGAAAENSSNTQAATYDYYPNGEIKSVTYPKLTDGSLLSANYEYDNINRLTKVQNKKGTQVISEFAYEYDLNGNIISATDGTGKTIYSYDKLNRLIKTVRPDGAAVSYGYDVRGNRSTLSATVAPSFDLSAKSYAYNEWDQLKQATKGSTTIQYSYEPDEGLRVKKSTPTATTRYSYNQNGEVISESNDSNQVVADYVWGPDRLLAKKDASTNNTYYYLYNGHQDVVQMVDTSGNVVNNYAYDEWGNIRGQTEGVANIFKYAGEIYDAETGLYYLRARYYDPGLGRFINKDKYEGDISNPLTLNQYSYVENNPLINIDPTGHWSIKKAFKTVAKASKATYNFMIGDDIRTLRSSHASLGAKIFAGVSIASNFIPGSGQVAKIGIKVTANVAKKQAEKLVTRQLSRASSSSHGYLQMFASNTGRSGKQARLKEIVRDDKVSSALRGEIKRDINAISNGKRNSIRVPQGYEMAHRRGYEARKGFGYKYSDLNTIKDHRRQHKFDGYGTKRR